MDNRAIEAFGGHPLNVLSAITVQTPASVISVDLLTAEQLVCQLNGVLDHFPVAAIKSGMLGSARLVGALASVLEKHSQIPYVLDPVCKTSSGKAILDPEGIRLMRERLIQRAQLITPNLGEMKILTERSNTTLEAAAQQLAEAHDCAVLLKGGHGGGGTCVDRLFQANVEPVAFSAKRIESRHTRGTGCALSALIATRLAHGDAMEAAVSAAKRALFLSIEKRQSLNWPGSGPAFGV